jgi:hypothetical protein
LSAAPGFVPLNPGYCAALIRRLVKKLTFLQGRAERRALPAAHPAATRRWLFLEFCNCLRIIPARTRQIAVMLITIFIQTPPHMADRLMTAESSIAHLTSSGLRALPART